MKKLILPLLATLSFFACKKNKTDLPPAPQVDTLGTGWQRLTSPVDHISDIFFATNSTGFLVSGRDIYRSLDAGNSWTKIYSANNAGFFNIASGSATNAVFVSERMLFITHDGGNSFDSTTLGGDRISDAFFLNPVIVYVVGTSLHKSVNAGVTWTAGPALGAGSGSEYWSLFFINEQTGWLMSTQSVHKTTNGGQTWQRGTVVPLDGSYSSLYFTDANTGYMGTSIAICKTTDGGSSWNIIAPATPHFADIHFVSTTTGYMANGTSIIKTTDSGATWTKVVSVPNSAVTEIHFTDATHGWACGSPKLLLRYAP